MSGEDSGRALTSLQRKRGVIKRSITCLVNTLKTLEATADAPGVVDHAKQLVTKLEDFDKDFCSVHFEIVDLFREGESEDLEKEHEVLESCPALDQLMLGLRSHCRASLLVSNVVWWKLKLPWDR